PLTPSPTLTTSPAHSPPPALAGAPALPPSSSPRFSDAARTRTRISPGLGSGVGVSRSSTFVSPGPVVSQNAFIYPFLRQWSLKSPRCPDHSSAEPRELARRHLHQYGQSCHGVRTRSGMRKKLTRTGNSLALVLDKRLLDRVGIDAETPLDVSTNGQVIVV